MFARWPCTRRMRTVTTQLVALVHTHRSHRSTYFCGSSLILGLNINKAIYRYHRLQHSAQFDRAWILSQSAPPHIILEKGQNYAKKYFRLHIRNCMRKIDSAWVPTGHVIGNDPQRTFYCRFSSAWLGKMPITSQLLQLQGVYRPTIPNRVCPID
jgi:hypothetical protein